MAGSQHFSPGDIQFQLVYDMGQCAESSYLNDDMSIRAQRSPRVRERTGELSSLFQSWNSLHSY